jgi:hypothetical protein
VITPAERARLVAWAKKKAVPVASCVAARIRLDHLSLRDATHDELLALVVVLADAADPVALRAVCAGKDDGGPVVTDRDLNLRRAHAECERLRAEGREVPVRLRLLEAAYQTGRREPRPRPDGLMAGLRHDEAAARKDAAREKVRAA